MANENLKTTQTEIDSGDKKYVSILVRKDGDNESDYYVRDLDAHIELNKRQGIPEKITYSELSKLKNNGNLEPGKKYEITDYKVVKVTSSGVPSYDVVEDIRFNIIIEATSDYDLGEFAKFSKREQTAASTQHNFGAWEAKYSFENNTSRFSWASSSGTGVIYWMKDENGNEAPYDFKTIKINNTVTFGNNCRDNVIKPLYHNNKYNLPKVLFGENCFNNVVDPEYNVSLDVVKNTVGKSFGKGDVSVVGELYVKGNTNIKDKLKINNNGIQSCNNFAVYKTSNIPSDINNDRLFYIHESNSKQIAWFTKKLDLVNIESTKIEIGKDSSTLLNGSLEVKGTSTFSGANTEIASQTITIHSSKSNNSKIQLSNGNTIGIESATTTFKGSNIEINSTNTNIKSTNINIGNSSSTVLRANSDNFKITPTVIELSTPGINSSYRKEFRLSTYNTSGTSETTADYAIINCPSNKGKIDFFASIINLVSRNKPNETNDPSPGIFFRINGSNSYYNDGHKIVLSIDHTGNNGGVRIYTANSNYLTEFKVNTTLNVASNLNVSSGTNLGANLEVTGTTTLKDTLLAKKDVKVYNDKGNVFYQIYTTTSGENKMLTKTWGNISLYADSSTSSSSPVLIFEKSNKNNWRLYNGPDNSFCIENTTDNTSWNRPLGIYSSTNACILDIKHRTPVVRFNRNISNSNTGYSWKVFVDNDNFYLDHTENSSSLNNWSRAISISPSDEIIFHKTIYVGGKDKLLINREGYLTTPAGISAGGRSNLNTLSAVTLSVSGDTTIGSSLSVVGGAILNSSLNVQGNTTLDSVTINRDASLGSNLGVRGNISTGSSLSVSGDTTLSGNTSIGSNDSNTLTITSKVNSNIIPSQTNKYTLGTSSIRWSNIYTYNCYCSSNLVSGTSIELKQGDTSIFKVSTSDSGYLTKKFEAKGGLTVSGGHTIIETGEKFLRVCADKSNSGGTDLINAGYTNGKYRIWTGNNDTLSGFDIYCPLNTIKEVNLSGGFNVGSTLTVSKSGYVTFNGTSFQPHIYTYGEMRFVGYNRTGFRFYTNSASLDKNEDPKNKNLEVLFVGYDNDSDSRLIRCSSKVVSSIGFYQSSDEKLKDIISPVKVDLDKLSKLRKVYYTWKNDPENKHIGLIAQDVQKIYPELVTTNDGHLTLSYDKLGVIALEGLDTLYRKHKDLEKKYSDLEKKLEFIEDLIKK